MPLTVFKYALTDVDAVDVEMPADAQVLSVVYEPHPLAGDPGGFFLYALVDPSRPTVMRRFIVTGTGQHLAVPEGAELGPFIGTVSSRSFYFHVFEVLL